MQIMLNLSIDHQVLLQQLYDKFTKYGNDWEKAEAELESLQSSTQGTSVQLSSCAELPSAPAEQIKSNREEHICQQETQTLITSPGFPEEAKKGHREEQHEELQLEEASGTISRVDMPILAN